ncbi:MAG: lactate permease LctP family transporter [Desulfovibrionaceae bacterium]|nr:lactate permease LctP family transporter [Desulfovibrionaceae bacterium]
MAWIQEYTPLGGTIASACVAAIPLMILFYMLAVRKAKGHVAAFFGLLSALIVAVAVWKMPVGLAISATLNGAAFGLFPIIWIVITAVWVYNMTVESGEFEIIKDSLARLTDDRRLQALFIAYAFSCFIEGTAGFGTPVAIAAAMLVGLGFTPMWGAGIALIANTAPVAFGAIGVPLIVAASVSGLDQMSVSAIAGRQLSLLALIVPLWVCVTMCGFKRSMEVLPAIIVSGICFGGAQFLLSNYHGPTLPAIGSAIATIIGLALLLRVWKPARTFRFEGESEANLSGQGYPLSAVIRAWGPYIVLAVFVFFWGLPEFKKLLNSVPGAVFAFGWPGLDGEVMKTAPIVKENAVYAAKYSFGWLSAGGTAILLSGLVSVPMMPNYGYGKAIACFVRTFIQLRLPIITIAMILGLAFLMNYAGMSSTLGLAFTLTGGLFPFFAPILGWLGVFLTGSDTSSCALFGGMQKDTAIAVGMAPELAVASNATGGVTAKMISPQSLSVATAATNMVGQEGNLFRFTIGHSIAMTLLLCILTYLQAGPLAWMLPNLAK